MSGPTPGPWKIGENELNWRSHVCGDSDGRVIAECMGYAAEQCEANARLIAAAPEMLETLRLAGEALTDFLEDEDCDHSVGICFCFGKAMLLDIGDIVARVKGEDNG